MVDLAPPRLHLHLISLDLDSVSLKNKRHWNSFTTDFFAPPARWIDDLERGGAVVTAGHAAEEAKLKHEMRCPLTGTPLANMPAVKSWLASAPFRSALSSIADCLEMQEERDGAPARWPLR